jgi:hypothetical protein
MGSERVTYCGRTRPTTRRPRAGQRTFFAGEAAWEFISGAVERSGAAGTPWEDKITLQTFYYLARTTPGDFIARVRQPALHLAAAVDPLSGSLELQREVRGRAGKDAEFAGLEPGHISTYFGKPFEESIATQLDFLDRKLALG